LLLASVEAVAIAFAASAGYYTLHGELPALDSHLPFTIALVLTLTFFMAAMGVYEARLREGYSGMLLRTAVAIFLLGTSGMAVLSYLLPSLSAAPGVLLFAATEAFVLVAIVRWLIAYLFDDDLLKRRVLVYGAGARAIKVASRMRRRSDRRAFVLVGFLQTIQGEDAVSEHGIVPVTYPENELLDYCKRSKVDEMVVASDERRAASESLDELMACRLSGIDVCEIQDFIEREASKIDVDLLQKSWLLCSDGFVTGGLRAVIKRVFDILAAFGLLFVLWPVMLLTAIAIRLFDGIRRPARYRQTRVGLNGTVFEVIKFRTMPKNAEDAGAVWADYKDKRATRLGRILRSTRIDELPQLFNVLRGEMSMVGPRPERPVFVEQLDTHLPYYSQRHRIKPGITGWAQLCYPYGASVEDAKEKLQYDLYYVKNHSILLDMIIWLKTVEVVLVGEGAR